MLVPEVQNLDSLKKIFRYKNIFTATVAIFVIFATINLIGTNILSTQGSIVSESETQTLKLEKENRQLSVKIEESVKLAGLEDLATQKGYVRSHSIVFVPTASTFASR